MTMILMSTRRQRRAPIELVSLVAILIAGTLGCATLFLQSEGEYVPPEVLEVLEGWIVSMDEGLRSVTIKDNEHYQTWTVSILEDTRIHTPEGAYLAISDLRIGDRVGVQGASRVKNHVTAHDVELLDDREGQDP